MIMMMEKRTKCVLGFLAVLRLGLVLLGQTGYIHPDEFFQGLEVLAGHAFNCSGQVFEPWEFRVDSAEQQPLRSLLLPALFYGTPLAALKALARLGLVQVSATSLIVAPRLFMTLASFLVDLALAATGRLLGLDAGGAGSLVLASSYVSLVYLTHTFSNSIEAVLFGLLVYLVVRSIKSGQNGAKETKVVAVGASWSIFFARNPRHFLEPVARQRRRPSEKLDCNVSLGGLIGLVIVLGVFNRPTFVLFSFVPLAFWALHGVDRCRSPIQALTWIGLRAAACLRLALPATLLAVLFDTFYYRGMPNLAEFSTRDLVVTPYNFFVYNSNASNVNQHGEHPRFQHFLVNSFLLFGPGHLLFVLASLGLLRHLGLSLLLRQRQRLVASFGELVNNVHLFVVLAYLFPLAMLSLITHQEPRFLLPLVVPLALLVGPAIARSRALRALWLLFNLVCVLVYGYAHQGGLTQSIAHLQRTFVDPAASGTDIHVIFHKTYMPPRYLLMAPYAELHRDSKGVLAIRAVHDLMSSSGYERLDGLITEIKSNQSSTRPPAVYLVTPAIFDSNLRKSDDKCRPRTATTTASFELERQFQVHVSFDHLKMHLDLLACKMAELLPVPADETYLTCQTTKCRARTLHELVHNALSLNVYRISL